MTPFTLAVPFLIALLVALALGGPVIRALKAGKNVQPISPDAPEKHLLKHGTPTMGGLFLCGAVLVACLYYAVATPLLRPVLAVFIAGAIIGFLDDLGKARKKENKAGLSERVKLGLQLAASAGFVASLYFAWGGNGAINATTLHLGVPLDLGVLYWPFAFLFIAFFGNAVNFTDGLDGLASGTTLIAGLTLGFLALISGVSAGIAPFFLAVAGACAGFVYWNAYPARVFMGDTGSQALGMGLAAAALAAKMEVPFLVVGAVYLAEIASMMLQRYVFKYRRIRFGIEYAKANRVFRRAPLHHHFEELGWHETQVVARFYVLALIAAAVGVMFAPYLMNIARPISESGVRYTP